MEEKEESEVQMRVVVFYLGQTHETFVNVPKECFAKHCWRPIAALKAGVLLGIPFTEMERNAKFGLRHEDAKRLFPKAGAGDKEEEKSWQGKY